MVIVSGGEGDDRCQGVWDNERDLFRVSRAMTSTLWVPTITLPQPTRVSAVTECLRGRSSTPGGDGPRTQIWITSLRNKLASALDKVGYHAKFLGKKVLGSWPGPLGSTSGGTSREQSTKTTTPTRAGCWSSPFPGPISRSFGPSFPPKKAGDVYRPEPTRGKRIIRRAHGLPTRSKIPRSIVRGFGKVTFSTKVLK